MDETGSHAYSKIAQLRASAGPQLDTIRALSPLVTQFSSRSIQITIWKLMWRVTLRLMSLVIAFGVMLICLVLTIYRANPPLEGVQNDREEAQRIVDDLNSHDHESLCIVECPDRHPGMFLMGETRGWIRDHQDQLKALGFTAKWNRDKEVYELADQ
jgi:hypothetical protein